MPNASSGGMTMEGGIKNSSQRGDVFAEHGHTQDGIMVPKQGLRGSGLFVSAPNQNQINGTPTEQFQQIPHQSHSSQVQEIPRQEQSDWLGNLQEKSVVQAGASQGVSSLDPTEEKLLFGTDNDASWVASFGRSGNSSTEASPSCQTAPDFQSSSGRFAYGHNDQVPINAPHESSQQSTKDAEIKQLDQGHQPKQFLEDGFQTHMQPDSSSAGAWVGHIYEQAMSTASAAELELKSTNMKGAWAHQQNTSLSNVSSGKSNHKHDGWHMNGPVPSNKSDNSSFGNHTDAWYDCQKADMNETVHTERDHSSMWKTVSNKGDFNCFTLVQGQVTTLQRNSKGQQETLSGTSASYTDATKSTTSQWSQNNRADQTSQKYASKLLQKVDPLKGELFSATIQIFWADRMQTEITSCELLLLMGLLHIPQYTTSLLSTKVQSTDTYKSFTIIWVSSSSILITEIQVNMSLKWETKSSVFCIRYWISWMSHTRSQSRMSGVGEVLHHQPARQVSRSESGRMELSRAHRPQKQPLAESTPRDMSPCTAHDWKSS
ncbi:hypothetical protein J5N97_010261 [Dioscorea zingiberensis]|uniref:Uncharacterized protein n=1 Tax=Dioscorea zingiberensis TaxID=325984 RepID=A0A9D5HML8_9LILI|nr:hypothetical protein J5N97_010261 [Dioscorea zingiberensis]